MYESMLSDSLEDIIEATKPDFKAFYEGERAYRLFISCVRADVNNKYILHISDIELASLMPILLVVKEGVHIRPKSKTKRIPCLKETRFLGISYLTEYLTYHKARNCYTLHINGLTFEESKFTTRALFGW